MQFSKQAVQLKNRIHANLAKYGIQVLSSDKPRDDIQAQDGGLHTHKPLLLRFSKCAFTASRASFLQVK